MSETEGNPQHPRHREFLRELGTAVFSAAGIAQISIDILRVHCNMRFFELVSKDLGGIANALREQAERHTHLPEFDVYASEVDEARVTRNDLIHSLPVNDGLHRRTATDPGRVVNFYSIADVKVATDKFDAVRGRGHRILYYDGGEAVRAWSARGGS